MLQWNTHFIVRDKAATCPRALLSFPAHWSTDYSWPLLYLEPTGDHRGKHHLGESFPSCKSARVATGMEAALQWCLDDSYMCCGTTKTEQWCPKQRSVQLITFPKFCTARESCTNVSFIVEIWPVRVQCCRQPGFLRITVNTPAVKSQWWSLFTD